MALAFHSYVTVLKDPRDLVAYVALSLAVFALAVVVIILFSGKPVRRVGR
jgi:hypothetical protein